MYLTIQEWLDNPNNKIESLKSEIEIQTVPSYVLNQGLEPSHRQFRFASTLASDGVEVCFDLQIKTSKLAFAKLLESNLKIKLVEFDGGYPESQEIEGLTLDLLRPQSQRFLEEANKRIQEITGAIDEVWDY